jgi:transposase
MQQPGSSANDLQMHCAVLAQQYPFAAKLNSQARQQAADRAWAAIARFYANCKAKMPGEEGLSPISASLPLGRVQGDRLEAGL